MVRLMQPLGTSPIPLALSGLYRCIVALRNACYDMLPFFSKDTGVPVVSVGGVHAGGTGKTPMTLLVGKYLEKQGRGVAFLSRGYRRKTKKIVVSRPGEAAAWDRVGDEPALLHASMPQSWLGIGAKRIKTARALLPLVLDKTVFILDDGFKHRSIRRDIDIVCLPPDPFDDCILPAGTLREPLHNIKRGHIICVIGSRDQEAILASTRKRLAASFKNKTIVTLFQVPRGWTNMATGTTSETLHLKKPTLLCAIARPERFVAMAERAGVSTEKRIIMGDHHEFTKDEINGACLAPCDGIITTEKDSFRLRTLKLVSCPDIWYLNIGIVFSDQDSEKSFFSRLNGCLS
jgi:tetraacyldisaccharide 4'-kinase